MSLSTLTLILFLWLSIVFIFFFVWVENRFELLQADYNKESKEYKNKYKELSKEYDNLRYKEKKHEHDIRKLENMNRGLQERVKGLLDNKDKKAYKIIGMKLLNQTKTSIFAPNSSNTNNNNKNNNNNNNSNNKRNSSISTFEINRYKEEQNQMSEENGLLQSQVAHLQQQMSEILSENMKLRQSLLELETHCKDAFNKATNVMVSLSEENSSDLAMLTEEFGNAENEINSDKYGMPFSISENLIRKDIHSSINNFSKSMNKARTSINANKIAGNNSLKMKNEMKTLQSQINDLKQQNIEYEKLIRVYVSNER